MVSRTHHLILLLSLWTPTSSFLPSRTVWTSRETITPSGTNRQLARRQSILFRIGASSAAKRVPNDEKASPAAPSLPRDVITTTGLISLAAWIAVSYMGLSRHPIPAVDAAATPRHNVLTIAQALALPVPVFSSVIAVLHHQATSRSVRRRLLLGVAAASFWTAAAIFWGPTFSVGLQVFSDPTRYVAGAIFGTHACLALLQWKREVTPSPSSLWRAPGYYISRIVRGCIGSIVCLLSPVVDTSDADNP